MKRRYVSAAFGLPWHGNALRRCSPAVCNSPPTGYWSTPYGTLEYSLWGTGVLPYGVLEYSLRGTGVLPTGHRSTPYGVLEYSLRGTLSTPGVGGGAGGFRPTGRPLWEEGPGCTLDCAWRCCPPFVAQPVCRGANRLYLQGQWLIVNAFRTSLKAGAFNVSGR